MADQGASPARLRQGSTKQPLGGRRCVSAWLLDLQCSRSSCPRRRSRIMQVDTVINAPKLFTGPYKTSFQFKRDRHYTPSQTTVCVPNDRSIDPVTGRQRFDTTPLDDLPPPPPG